MASSENNEVALENEDPFSITAAKHYFTFNYSKYKNLPNGEKVSSPVFIAFGHGWVIDCFPQGKQNFSDVFVSIFLRLVDESSEASVRFELRIPHKNGVPHLDKLHRFHHGIFLKQNATVGHSFFIRRTHLISEYLKDGGFQICCTFFHREKTLQEFPTIEYPWPQSSICQELAKVLSSGDMADVTIEVGGKTFKVHKLVLALQSPVFKAELYGDMAEAKSGCVKINDMEAVVFEAMINFMYTNNFHYYEINDENKLKMVKDLLVAADRYALDELKLTCEEMLCQNIKVDCVVTSLALAELYNCPRLKDDCLSFIAIASNFKSVTLQEAYINLMHTFPSLLKELGDKVSKMPQY
ncbi:BTB/POZ and MATH domain-containing protein 1 [Rhynchospora pubera]|uniref:BTB/POZ and MATH domain-containing protein 1 n=1 Tax=Rhynchospora pubera TaxID=906938 RepID=A0AAV8D1M8_9POAL|nr:BTB/POZ and MATH domain-containing protein 1 [Rhynchospora pubera]